MAHSQRTTRRLASTSTVSSTHRLATQALIAAVIALVALGWWMRSPLHHMPLERDEGAYALIAARWLAGDRLYADVFDHKPPLIYLVYALAWLLPGGSVGAIRTLATLYMLATGLVLFALGWRLYGRWAAANALAVFLAYGSSLSFQGLTFNTESVMALPALAGCLLLVWSMQRKQLALLGLAGLCAGLAAAAKPVGAILLAPLCLAPLLLCWPWRRRLAAAALGLGAALLPLLTIAIALWTQGALPAAFEALITYNRLYAAESASDWDPSSLWRMWAPMLALGLPALVGLIATLLKPGWHTAAHTIAALWGLALLATALLSLRAFPHYYMAAVPWLSLWSGALIVALGQLRWLERWPARLLGMALLCALLAPPVREIWPLRTLSPDQQIRTLYGLDGDQFFWPAAEVAAFLAARVPPDQPIFVWAAEPEIYYLARRRPATRFVYDYPIDRLPGARDAVLTTLRQTPPKWLITYRGVRPIGFHPFANDYGYRLQVSIGGFDLFVQGVLDR